MDRCFPKRYIWLIAGSFFCWLVRYHELPRWFFDSFLFWRRFFSFSLPYNFSWFQNLFFDNFLLQNTQPSPPCFQRTSKESCRAASRNHLFLLDILYICIKWYGSSNNDDTSGIAWVFWIITTFNGWTKIQGDDGGIFRSKHGRLCHRCVDVVRWNADCLFFVVDFFVEKNLRSLKCRLNKQYGKYRWFLTIQNWVIDATSTFCDICMCDYTDWFSLCHLFLSSHFKPRHPHHPHTHLFWTILGRKILWSRPHQCIQACERMVAGQVGGERQGTADLPCHMVWRDVMQLGTKLENSRNVDQCMSWCWRAKEW